MLTHYELMNISDEEIIRYILELSGYNDIIYVINKTLEAETEAETDSKIISSPVIN